MDGPKMTLKEEAVAAAHKKLCLADDAAMTVVLQNNPRLAKAILVPILGRSDFAVVKVQTQKHVEGFDGHSVRFDCLIRFQDGTLCDLEIQKSGGGMNAERVQTYQDALGSLALRKREDYTKRKRTVLVVINDGDLLEAGLPLYEIRPMVLQTGKPFHDKSVIYIANLRDKDPTTELGRLMADLECTEPDKMQIAPLREGLEMIQSEAGEEMMEREMENLYERIMAEGRRLDFETGHKKGQKEGRLKGQKEGGSEMLIKLVRSGKITVEDAADELGISVEDFERMMKAKA